MAHGLSNAVFSVSKRHLVEVLSKFEILRKIAKMSKNAIFWQFSHFPAKLQISIES